MLAQQKYATLGLIGDLGTGKTTFVKELLNYCSPELGALVSSPSYSYLNIYQNSAGQNWPKLVTGKICHFDLYRVENYADLFEIGLFDMQNDMNSIIFIEWVDKFPQLIDTCVILLEFKIENDGQHYLEILRK